MAAAMPEAIESLLATPTISTRLPVRKPMCLSLFWLFGSAGRHEGGFQQLLCIRMLWCRKNVSGRTLFHYLALLDHHHLVAQRPDHRQVMADEQVGQVVLGLQRAQKLYHLALYRAIEREVGSSSSISAGFNTRARAMAMRCRCPPENSWG